MKLKPGFHKWLKAAGYQFHCFISWPHIQDPDTIECARRLKNDIERSLSQVIPDPKVFLSTDDITGGDKWRVVLHDSLCRSICMVAICAPIYYDPSHYWCGVEWAAMETLARTRIPEESFGTIIPVLIRRYDPLPSAVAEAQYHDMSDGFLLGKGYYKTKEYRRIIRQIVDKIISIATAIHRQQVEPACEDFIVPERSAFEGYFVEEQPPPFRQRTSGSHSIGEPQ